MDILNAEERDLLYRVQTKPELQPFFFRKLKGLHWFDPLLENHFLDPDRNPKPIPTNEEGYVSVPHWIVTDYLVKISEGLSDATNEQYAVKMMNLIRRITLYAQIEGFSNFRTWWQFAKILNNIPAHIISLEDLNLIDYWLNDPYETALAAEELGSIWLPALLKNLNEHSRNLALKLLEILLKVNILGTEDSSKENKAILRLNFWMAKKIIPMVAKLSGEYLGIDAINLFKDRLVFSLKQCENDKWSSIWRPAIEEHEQNRTRNEANEILLDAFRDCLMGFFDHNPTKASEYVLSLLDCPFQLIKRVSIFAIERKFSFFKSKVDLVLSSEYFQDNYRHETWNLLHQHFIDFNPIQKSKVIEIIQGLKSVRDNGKSEDGSTAYKRVIWLSSIKDCNSEACELYNKYTNITGVEPEHPDFSSYISFTWMEDKAPFSIEHLMSLNIDDLADTLNNYEDPGQFSEINLEGLVKVFKDVAKTKAHEYYIELDKFLKCDFAFVYPLLESYRELWNEKKSLPWDDVWIHIIESYLELLNQVDFWTEAKSSGKNPFVANRNSVLNAICKLVEDGTRSDDHAFNPNLLPKAKQILVNILDNQPGTKFRPQCDAVIESLSSARGQCLQALINHSLYYCRIMKNENLEQAWGQYKDIYNAELKRADQGEIEFITLSAMYIQNFIFMSKEWVEENLPNIFDVSKYNKWLCAIQGYANSNIIGKTLYSYLKEKGCFLKALDDNNLQDRVKEKFVQYIVTTYLLGDEDINDSESLIAKLINRRINEEIHQFIWYIWASNKKVDNEIKDKIFELWARLLEVIDFSNIDGKKLASLLCNWIVYIDEINTKTELYLLKIAPFVDVEHNTHNFTCNLARLSAKQPIQVQKIWLKMLESYSYDYPGEGIKTILRNLINHSPEGKRKAKEVIDAYLKYGLERPRIWLKEIESEN